MSKTTVDACPILNILANVLAWNNHGLSCIVLICFRNQNQSKNSCGLFCLTLNVDGDVARLIKEHIFLLFRLKLRIFFLFSITQSRSKNRSEANGLPILKQTSFMAPSLEPRVLMEDVVSTPRRPKIRIFFEIPKVAYRHSFRKRMLSAGT